MTHFLLSDKMKGRICSWLLMSLLIFGTMMVHAQELRQYHIHVSFPKGGAVSGVCVVRMNGGEGKMSVINEFGIKVFDAVYSDDKSKVKLFNVIAPLDKWYIRRVIAKDMCLIFHPDGRKMPKRRVFTYNDDGSMTLINKRFDIVYQLHPIDYVTE